MFDLTTENIIRPGKIDTTENTMLLTSNLHYWFGQFLICFDQIKENQYDVKSWDEVGSPRSLPLEVTLRKHGISTANLPLHGLLKTHKAIGKILHVSGAGESVDRLLRELDEGIVDGSGGISLGDLVECQLSRTGDIKYRSLQGESAEPC